MSWFVPAPAISDAARKLFQRMVDAGSSEGSGVVETLNTIAENGEEQSTDEFLAGCAEEMRGWCEEVIKTLGTTDGEQEALEAPQAG